MALSKLGVKTGNDASIATRQFTENSENIHLQRVLIEPIRVGTHAAILTGLSTVYDNPSAYFGYIELDSPCIDVDIVIIKQSGYDYSRWVYAGYICLGFAGDDMPVGSIFVEPDINYVKSSVYRGYFNKDIEGVRNTAAMGSYVSVVPVTKLVGSVRGAEYLKIFFIGEHDGTSSSVPDVIVSCVGATITKSQTVQN